jgi:hypothetical protein
LVFKTTAAGARSAAFLRDVQVGDRVQVQGTATGPTLVITQQSRVVGFYADPVVATIDPVANGPDNQVNQSADPSYSVVVTKAGSSTDVVGALTGTYLTDLANGLTSDTYTVECTTGGSVAGAKFLITNASGTATAVDVAAAGGPLPGAVTLTDAMLRGITLNFTGTSSSAFVAGETWTWTIKAAFVALVDTTNITAGGTYSGAVDTTYILTVTTGGNYGTAKVTITDSQGSDYGTTVTVPYNTAINVGTKSLTVLFKTNSNTQGGAFAQGGLRLGDVYTVDVTAVADGLVRTLVLADDIDSRLKAADESGPIDLELRLYIFKSEVEIPYERVSSPPDVNFEAGADIFTVESGIVLQSSDWVDSVGDLPWLDLIEGSLYISYRALNKTGASVINSLTGGVASISEVGSTVDVDDPLTYGVYQAALNAGDRTVYWARVPTDDLAGYLSVLDAASQTNKVYAFSVTTYDRTVQDAVASHLLAMSTETARKWRRAYMSAELPVESTLLEFKTDGTTPYIGTITGTAGNYTTLTIPTATMLSLDVRYGDLLDINFQTDPWGDPSWETYTIDEVNTETTATLVSGPSSPFSTAIKVRIRRPLTKDEQAEAYGALANHFSNRRVALVFPPTSYYNGVAQPGWALSCGVAGLRSSVVPQQGLTNSQLLGVDDIPMTYQYFNSDQLSVIASYGVYIIAMDEASGAAYIRHQLTTDIESLLTREDSIGTNVDAMAYYFLDRLAVYIGKYNNTPAFRQLLRTTLNDAIGYLSGGGSTPASNPDIGSQLISGTITKLETVPGAQDTVVIVLGLVVPSPVNVLDVTLQVSLES